MIRRIAAWRRGARASFAVTAAHVLAALLALARTAVGRADELADAMAGLDGPYAMTREGSGTSWQPDSTPLAGVHQMHGRWMTMLHGMADLVYDDQGGARGATQTFSSSMVMFMARRDLDAGALGVRLMASSDPFMGPRGYPLLLQSGETADGREPLIDRQHPHDLLMEAAVTYSHNVSADSSWFWYAGLPGAPALGPNAFMHRLSGMDNPEAPLAHHWLDSTHITWGVLTGGWTWRQLRLEASAFNGREPDQNRYNIELRRLDSYSARLSYNPTPDWSVQASFGRLASPEQLEPAVSLKRSTASVSYNAPLARWWQTTLAWGRNVPSSGTASLAWLLESAASLAGGHTLFGRIERVDKDELFLPGSALAGRSFTVNKLSLGYIHDLARLAALDLGLGAVVSAYRYPEELDPAYGSHPRSFMVFVRARL
jgi:hypothetical protein